MIIGTQENNEGGGVRKVLWAFFFGVEIKIHIHKYKYHPKSCLENKDI